MEPQALRWLRRHREVRDRVRVGDLGLARGSRAAAAQCETAVDGYLRGLDGRCRRRCGRVVVLRDTPEGARGHRRLRAAGDRRPPAAPAPRCALPRSRGGGARPGRRGGRARYRTDRVRLADLTRFICDARRCYPVVGGALVYKDEHHMTTVFARTLWPYLARRVDRLLEGA